MEQKEMKNEKWALITGSNRGIGEQILLKFAANGYHIAAHARKRTEEFEQKIQKWQETYGIIVEPLYFDMTDTAAMESELQKFRSAKRKINVLVNNAGVMHAGLFQMTPVEEIKSVFDTNLFSVMELTQRVLKFMVRKKDGCIINISSITGQDLGIGQCAYGVSKAAVAAFTKTLSAELSNYGIRVNAVAPGMADTRMAESDSVRMEKEKMEQKKSPFSRLASPEEIASTVYFLASDAASFITGQILRVDGGNHL